VSAGSESELPSLLVVEPDFLMRRIIVSVVRDMALARPSEALGIAPAERLLQSTAYDALLLAMSADDAALTLLAQLRQGRCTCAAATPVAVATAQCDAGLVQQLHALGVRRVLIKPFKVKDVIETVTRLCSAPTVPA